MKRMILAVLAGVVLGAGTASAQPCSGRPAPGYSPNNPAGCNWMQAANNGTVAAGQTPGAQGSPGVLGPWYLYYPLEAHFITPAHPQFPFWPSPQTLYKGQPDAVPPVYAIPSYWK